MLLFISYIIWYHFRVQVKYITTTNNTKLNTKNTTSIFIFIPSFKNVYLYVIFTYSHLYNHEQINMYY